MSCGEYVLSDGAVLTVCGGGASVVLAVEDEGVRWCFYCRRRVPFTATCRGYVEPSYYDPWWTVACERGHVDGHDFPGCGPL